MARINQKNINTKTITKLKCLCLRHRAYGRQGSAEGRKTITKNLKLNKNPKSQYQISK